MNSRDLSGIFSPQTTTCCLLIHIGSNERLSEDPECFKSGSRASGARTKALGS